MKYRLCILFYCLSFFTYSVLADDVEWIAVRRNLKGSWGELSSQLPDFEFLSSFGHLKRFALLKLRKGKRVAKTLPPFLVHLQPNYTYSAFQSADPDFSKSWALLNLGQSISTLGNGTPGVDIDAQNAWKNLEFKRDAVVAVLDSGIDLNHEDLKNCRWKNALEVSGNQKDDDGNGFVDDLSGWNFVSENSNVMDDNNHGSFVSGIIAADSNNSKGSRGLSTHAKIMSVKMLDENGMSSTERAVKGIEYAVNNGAKIINASWGGSSYDQVLFDTIGWAAEKGVLFIAAAGNSASSNDIDEKPTYPASFKIPNIISVAAYDFNDKLAKFSNFGKETVHLGAPGVGIYSTIVNGYKFSEGTSYAAPFVSGVAALLYSAFSDLEFSQVKERLLASTTPLPYYSKEKLISAGRLNAYNAVKDHRPLRPKRPTGWKRVEKNTGTQHPYPNDLKQTFELNQPNAKFLRVHFVSFDLENNYDSVVLKDKTGTEITAYTGNWGSFWSAEAIGDTLRIEFKSDFSNSKYGFDIDAIEYVE